MNSQEIELKNAPEVLKIIRRADPSYRKRKAMIVVSSTVELHDTFWSDGTRSTYRAVNLTSGQIVDAPQFSPPEFGGPPEVLSVNVPEDGVIVQTGYFCGKVATAVVYVTSSNATKLMGTV